MKIALYLIMDFLIVALIAAAIIFIRLWWVNRQNKNRGFDYSIEKFQNQDIHNENLKIAHIDEIIDSSDIEEEQPSFGRSDHSYGTKVNDVQENQFNDDALYYHQMAMNNQNFTEQQNFVMDQNFNSINMQ